MYHFDCCWLSCNVNKPMEKPSSTLIDEYTLNIIITYYLNFCTNALFVYILQVKHLQHTK